MNENKIDIQEITKSQFFELTATVFFTKEVVTTQGVAICSDGDVISTGCTHWWRI